MARSGNGVYQSRGAWCFDYRDALGRRHVEVARDPITGKSTETLAKRMRAERMAAIVTGSFAAPSAMTFEQLATAYLEHVQHTVRAETHADYSEILRRLGRHFGRMQVRKVTAANVDAYRNDRARDGLAARTINKDLTLLAQLFGFARKRGIVATNPAAADLVDRLPVPKVRRDDAGNEIARALDPADLQRLLDAADAIAENALRFKGHKQHAPACHAALLWLLAYSGLRISEALALTWADLDFDAGTVRVRRRLRQGKIGDPKSETSARSVPIRQALVDKLKAWRLRSHAPDKSATGIVFCSSSGMHESDANVRHRGMKNAAERAKLARAPGLHDLRHGFGSMLIAAGVDLQRVSRMLGHGDVAITASVYVHDLHGMADDSAAKLDALLAGNLNKISTSGEKKVGTANDASANPLKEVVPEIGIEPTTYALRMRRSTN